MVRIKGGGYVAIYALWLGLGIVNNGYSMGLRSLVTLPVEKGGTVIRFTYQHTTQLDTDSLTTNAAYGFSANQTLLLGIPYQFSGVGEGLGDVSILYRHIIWQEDKLSGTDRLGFLGGAIIPTDNDRDAAVQAGLVFTHFKNRHEIDIDALYQAGIKNRLDSGRYDISWQYRLVPVDYPDWGIAQQINSVLELNGRWTEGSNMTHQVTAGFQWVHQKLVIDGGLIKDLNNDNEAQYILSARFHF